MAQASIFTLEPERGGVPALTRVVDALLRRRGHTPTLVYRASESVPTGSRLGLLRYFLTTRPITRLDAGGLQRLAVADYPMPTRYQYHLLRLARQAIHAPIAAVVSGSSHVGLPLALANRPYLVWAATLYESEVKGRAAAGDAWATRLLRQNDWRELEAQEKLVYERARLILGLSPNTTKELGERFPTVKHKLRTVLYPIDTDVMRPDTGASASPYIFLSARIQDPRKNVNLLLHAFAKVLQQLPGTRLVIAGDQPTAEAAALAQTLGIAQATQFAGFVSKEALLALYQQASVFALPSQQEGLCIAMLEAMACGVPVVSTRCGGPEGIVEEGQSGYLVANGDAAALAEGLLAVLQQPGLQTKFGQRGRQIAVEMFSQARVNQQLDDAFADTFGEVW